jgi:hypothetical protein
MELISGRLTGQRWGQVFRANGRFQRVVESIQPMVKKLPLVEINFPLVDGSKGREKGTGIFVLSIVLESNGYLSLFNPI